MTPSHNMSTNLSHNYWKNIIESLPMNQLFQVKSASTDTTTFKKTLQLDQTTCDQINLCCSLNEIDCFTIFLSAMTLLVTKFTNSPSAAIGCPTNESNDTAIFHDLLQNPLTIKQYFKKILKKTREMREHSSYSISKVMNELNLDRETNLFPASLMLTKKNMGIKNIKPHYSSFDINIIDDHGNFTISVNADSSILEDWQIQSLIATYNNILKLITATENIGKNIISLETLSSRDYDVLLNQWSQHNKAHTPYIRIEHAFNIICESYPDKIAIEHNDKKYTYDDIDQWSDKVANAFTQLNQSGVLALCMEKSVELTVSVIAALKANLTYLLIDPKYPAARIQYMLQDTGSNIVITNTSPELGTSSSTLIHFSDLDLSNNTTIKAQNTNPIACIIYTSGSTGNPKPVMVSHTGIINLIWNQHKYFGVSQKDRFLQFSSISFDSSIAEIWIPLLSGATSIIPDDRYLSGSLLQDCIVNNKVSVLIIPPSILDTIPDPDAVCKTLKVLVSVGEALTLSTANAWLGKLPYFLNAYGPSEGTVLTSFCYYSEETLANNIIGKPIDGVNVYVFNDNLTLAPIGCIGELYIGGAGLSPGYYQHPELDAGRFIQSPFSANERLYKTGDLVRWQHNGNLQYVGRIDRQVKLNGIRIELEEIENQLLDHNFISLCAVCIETDDINSEKKLVAYFTCSDDSACPNSATELKKEIRQYLLNQLPMSMVPHHYVQLNEFPRLPNGKIARDKLHKLTTETPNEEANSSLPEKQHDVAMIYAQILKTNVADITADSDFFELGGTSLHALNAVASLNENLNICISIEDFFDCSKVSTVAEKIKTDNASELNALYASCLGLDKDTNLDPHEDFFTLGGSSLSAIRLLSELKNKFGIQLSIESFFDKSSIADMTQIIFLNTNNCEQTSSQAPNDDDDFDIEDDLFFDIESIGGDASSQNTPPVETHKHVLLTGAAGFLGAYLLTQLLKCDSTITVHCLLRPGNSNTLIDRVKHTLTQYHLNDTDLHRVCVYEGDIARDRLGLSEENYLELSTKIDSIYHCAAAVNHIYAYGMLRQANVLGTIELIKLATNSKKKSIHYVSALDVALIKHNVSDFTEEKEAALLEMGYIQTKWVAEYLLEKAASLLNLSIGIYRPGNIIGDLKKGIMNPATNHFSMLTKGCIQLGYAPQSSFLVEMTPVDIIAKSIVELSRSATPNNPAVYNLHNSTHISWEEYVKILNKNGYDIKLIDTDTWCNKHIANIDSTNALYPFKAHYSHHGLRFNTKIADLPYQEVSTLLEKLNVYFPKDYPSINSAHLRQLREVAFL